MGAERGRQKPRAKVSTAMLEYIEAQGSGKYELTAFGHKTP